MGQQTEILWADSTWNPWWGCTKISEGCAHCYADSFSHRLGLKIWGQDADRRFFGDKHWAELIKWDTAAKKAGVMRSVFCGSMCDIFEDRPDLVDPRMTVLDFADPLENLLFLFLTKRPQNAIAMLPKRWAKQWPRNVMIGTTIENQPRLIERMEAIKRLRQEFPGISVFASCEPLLSGLDWKDGYNSYLELLDWVVAGGESGAGARPCHPNWARKLRDDCADRTDMCRPWPLPFLWKQWGGLHPKSNGRLIDGKEHAQFPRLSYGPQLALHQLTEAK